MNGPAADWDAAQYLKFEEERTRPSRDLAGRIPLTAPRRILDAGCGPGNSTRVLLERFPAAEICGIDSSREMLEEARKKLPGVRFENRRITPECEEIPAGFDLIFSNACLQWVPDHRQLIPALFARLAPGGCLALQLPLMEQMPISAILADAAAEAAWKEPFRSVQDLHSLTWQEYYDVAATTGASFEIWTTHYVHTLPGPEALVEWYCGSRLRPYLAALPETEQSPFLQFVKERLGQAHAQRADGCIAVPFPRLFLLLMK